MAQADVEDVPVPMEEHPSFPGEFMENPLDPAYEEAVKAAIRKRGELVVDCILRRACLVISLPEGDFIRRKIEREFGKQSVEHALVALYCLDNMDDHANVAYNACLTERRVTKHLRALRITKTEMGVAEPIDRAPLRHVVSVGISSGTIQIGSETLVSLSDEYDACVAAGCDWSAWCAGVYDLDFLSMTVALNRAAHYKALHSSDAVQEATKEANKPKSDYSNG